MLIIIKQIESNVNSVFQKNPAKNPEVCQTSAVFNHKNIYSVPNNVSYTLNISDSQTY
jgi:hypothetical protein